LCALKSGKCSIKSGGKQYKISEIQVFAGAALNLYLPENILQTPDFFGQIAVFLGRAYICLLRQVMAVLYR
jgi:hypothetical protein